MCAPNGISNATQGTWLDPGVKSANVVYLLPKRGCALALTLALTLSARYLYVCPGRASSARVGVGVGVSVCLCVRTAVVVCFGLPLIAGPLFLQFELSSSDTHSRCSNFSLMLLLLFCCFFLTFIFIVILGIRPGLPLLLVVVVLGTDHESTEKFASMGKLCKQ